MDIKLLTKALLKTLPALYSQEDSPDPMVVLKLFTPDAGWTWYAIEGSPVDANGYYDTDPAILILAFPWIRDCSWRPTSLKVGLPLALGDCDAPALKPRSSPGDFTSAHHWPTRRAQP